MQPNALPRPVGPVAPALLALALTGALLLAPGVLAQAERDVEAAPAAPPMHDPTWAPALAYRTPATLAAERAVREAQTAASRSHTGWGAAVSLAPSVAWRGTAAAPADAARWRTDVGGELSLRHDPAVVARAALAAHRAEVALGARVFRDLREALTLHVDLQRAHVALTLAEQTAVDRDATRTAAEASAGGGVEPVPVTLAAARLAAERANAEVERAGRALAEAERRAAVAGFDPALGAARHRDRTAPLPFEGWRLALPDVAPDATPAVVTARWLAEGAAATLTRVELGGVLEDVWLDTSLALPDVRLRASLDLDEGRPGAAFDVALRPATGSSWTVAVGARLRIEDGTLAATARARAEVDEAAAALEAARVEAPHLLALARQAALDAEADVAFAERALVIGRAGLSEAVARWRDATDGEAAADPAARARANAALSRAAIGFERERDAFLRAWNTYLLQVERYLAVAGSSGGVLAPP